MKVRLGSDTAAEVLGATALFGDLDPHALASLAAAAMQRTYARGQYLCYQGDSGDWLFVVAEGLVKVGRSQVVSASV